MDRETSARHEAAERSPQHLPVTGRVYSLGERRPEEEVRHEYIKHTMMGSFALSLVLLVVTQLHRLTSLGRQSALGAGSGCSRSSDFIGRLLGGVCRDWMVKVE